jgi:serine/threonine protein kinase
VAVKILKTHDKSLHLSKRMMLDSFFNEIKILSHCRHPNIVKLLDASLNGTLIKERVSVRTLRDSIDRGERGPQSEEEDISLIKRKTNICYCVLNLVKFGELYKFLELTDKFSDSLSRTLFL